MSERPEPTPLVVHLRSVHPDAVVNVTLPSGWQYSADWLGVRMHEAADLIEKLQARLDKATRKNIEDLTSDRGAYD